MSRGAAAGWRLNPVLYKDLLVFARTPGGAGGLQQFWLAAVLGLPLVVYAWLCLGLPGPWRWEGRPLVLGAAGLLTLITSLSVGVPAATAFALERERETLEGLVVSPLSPRRLVMGKLGAALAIGMFQKAAALPALALACYLGGQDPSFVPCFLLLLLASDVSLGSFALWFGARRREGSARVGWIRSRSSQVQLAVQGVGAIVTLLWFLPSYLLLGLLPLLYAQGALPELLDATAPLGALHPVLTLLLWGQASLFGLRLPVWLLGVVLHLLLALPFLADAAESQRSEGEPPGRAPRLLLLPAAAFLLLVVSAPAPRLPQPARVALVALLPCLLSVAAARMTFLGAPPRPAVERAAVLRGLLPHLALQSHPSRAPGYVLLLSLLLALPTWWASGGGGAVAATLLGATLGALAICALGLRLLAGGRERDDQALLTAMRQPTEGEGEEEGEATRHLLDLSRLVQRLFLLGVILPVLSALGLALARSLPLLSPLQGPLEVGLTCGLAMNPLAAALPMLSDPGLVGSPVWLNLAASLGVDPAQVFGLHLLLATAVVVRVLVGLRPPLDADAALAAVRAGRVAAPPPGPDPSPAGSAPGTTAGEPASGPASPESER